MTETHDKRTETHACDLISRQAAIKAADSIIERDTSGNNDVVKAMTAWKEYIKALPSATYTNVATTDTISRNAALDVLHGYFDGMLETDTVCPKYLYNEIEALPPAQPDHIGEVTEMVGDTISRQAALDVLNRIDEYNPRSIFAITELPPAQRWIPVTERLPGMTGTYLVQVGINENGEGMLTAVRTAEWNVIWQTWYVHTTHRFVGDIIKWMPIPWKGEEHGTPRSV